MNAEFASKREHTRSSVYTSIPRYTKTKHPNSHDRFPLLPNRLCPSLHDRCNLRAPDVLRALRWRLSKAMVALALVALRLRVLERDAIVERKRPSWVPPRERGPRGHRVRRHDGAAAVEVLEDQAHVVFVDGQFAGFQNDKMNEAGGGAARRGGRT